MKNFVLQLKGHTGCYFPRHGSAAFTDCVRDMSQAEVYQMEIYDGTLKSVPRGIPSVGVWSLIPVNVNLG